MEHGEAIHRLVERAREDQEFFHDLVFNTENVLDRLDYVGRQIKGSLVAISPEEFFGAAVGVAARAGGCSQTCDASCNFTCGASSCGRTCGARSCSVTVRFTERFQSGGFSAQGEVEAE